MLEVENQERRFADLLRRGNEIHMADTVRLVQAGIADGTIRDEDPVLLALGVVGAVAYYGHFHRTRRADLPVAELAAFVGRYVVRALAADEEIAGPRAPGVARGDGYGAPDHRPARSALCPISERCLDGRGEEDP